MGYAAPWAAAESQHRSWGGGKGRDGLWEPRTFPRDQRDEEGTVLRPMTVTMTMGIFILAPRYREPTPCQALC